MSMQFQTNFDKKLCLNCPQSGVISSNSGPQAPTQEDQKQIISGIQKLTQKDWYVNEAFSKRSDAPSIVIDSLYLIALIKYGQYVLYKDDKLYWSNQIQILNLNQLKSDLKSILSTPQSIKICPAPLIEAIQQTLTPYLKMDSKQLLVAGKVPEVFVMFARVYVQIYGEQQVIMGGILGLFQSDEVGAESFTAHKKIKKNQLDKQILDTESDKVLVNQQKAIEIEKKFQINEIAQWEKTYNPESDAPGGPISEMGMPQILLFKNQQ